MFEIKGDAVVATTTELRRDPTPLLERVDRGQSVVLHKHGEPVGVLLSYPAYQEIMTFMGQFENLQWAMLALRREERILRGEDRLIPADEMAAKYGITAEDLEDGEADEG